MQRSERTTALPDGQKIALYEWRPQNPKAVVLLVHGLGEHAGRYEHVAQAFNDHGYALVGFDHPGHGKSDGVRGHIPSYAVVTDFITRLLSEISGSYPGLPQFLYGHSMGGNIGLYYLLTCRPQLAGAIITSPGLGTTEPVPAWKTLMGKVLFNIAPAMQMDNGLNLAGLAHDPTVIQAYKDDPLVHGKISVRLGIEMLGNGKDIVARAAEFPDTPLLLMQGSQDPIVSPQVTDQFAKAYHGNLTYKVWDGLYHELHNEPQKPAVIQTMIDWLDAHPPA